MPPSTPAAPKHPAGRSPSHTVTTPATKEVQFVGTRSASLTKKPATKSHTTSAPAKGGGNFALRSGGLRQGESGTGGGTMKAPPNTTRTVGTGGTPHGFSRIINPKRWYAIAQGRHPEDIGVYTNWEEVRIRVDGVSRARYKGFPTEQAAETWLARMLHDLAVAAQAQGTPTAGSTPAPTPGGAYRVTTPGRNNPIPSRGMPSPWGTPQQPATTYPAPSSGHPGAPPSTPYPPNYPAMISGHGTSLPTQTPVRQYPLTATGYGGYAAPGVSAPGFPYPIGTPGTTPSSGGVSAVGPTPGVGLSQPGGGPPMAGYVPGHLPPTVSVPQFYGPDPSMGKKSHAFGASALNDLSMLNTYGTPGLSFEDNTRLAEQALDTTALPGPSQVRRVEQDPSQGHVRSAFSYGLLFFPVDVLGAAWINARRLFSISECNQPSYFPGRQLTPGDYQRIDKIN